MKCTLKRKSFRLLLVILLFMYVEVVSGQASYNRDNDQHGLTVFMKNGGWCWFQDPRAIIADRKLIMGAVKGHGDGEALVGVYDLKKKKSLGSVIVHDHFDHDDHNSPVFYQRPDGSILTMYARHHVNNYHYYRISKPGNPMQWGEEVRFEHNYPGAGKVTYMNLYPADKKERLYNFFRGINFNPSLIISEDDGKSWGHPTHLIANEVEGNHRPYARYAGQKNGTVHISFTDAHPHLYGNSIYYAAFREGKFYRADGTPIKDLAKDGPLRPSEAEVIYQGSGINEDRDGFSAPNSAWTSSIVFDSKGNPHIGYSVYISNSDRRYRIASWDGTRWIDREVAYAGSCLYPEQSSYTGLITLDPKDPSYVLISSDVDPSTGGQSGQHHEIYRAEVNLTDSVNSIKWQPLTSNSPVQNIRPIIVRDGKFRVLAWLRGDYQAYIDYDLDVVGEVEKTSEQ